MRRDRQHEAVGVQRIVLGLDGPARTQRHDRRSGADSLGSDARDQGLGEIRKPAVQRHQRRLATPRWWGSHSPTLAQGGVHAAVPGGDRVDLRRGATGTQLRGVTGVHTTEQRLDQPPVHPIAEAGLHEVGDARIFGRAGCRQHEIQARPRDLVRSQQPGAQ